MRRTAALLLLIVMLPGLAFAEARVGLRTGEHPGHGRLVFDWPERVGYETEASADRIVLRFAAPASFDLAGVRRPPRNMRGIEANGDTATIMLAPGAQPRVFRLGNRIVVDALDPTIAATPPSRAPSRAPAPPPRPAVQRAAPPAPPVAAPVPPAAAPPAITEAVAVPPPAAPVQPRPRGLLVPASAEVGAALLRRGDVWLLVLDASVALDAAPLRDGPFAAAQISRGPHATVLRLPSAAVAEPVLTRRPDGWLLEIADAPPPLRTIRAELDAGPPPRLMLRAARPGNSVAVLDPETAGTLLIGTVREGGEGVPVGRRATAFEVLPTRLGAAILPRADSVTMRALASGFATDPGPGTVLALGPDPDAAMDAATLSRVFDLPDQPLASLIERERSAMLAVAAAPPLGRGPPRLRAAEALLALGLGAEAQSLAALAMREDPRAAQDSWARALHGAAALVAGRIAEADGLLDPRLPETDELVLWRGLLAAARGEDGAAQIASAAPLLRTWPEPLRHRFAPLGAEALAAGGEQNAARRLLAGREDDPAYALARARLLEAAGDSDAAIAAYAAVAGARDRRARAVAMRRLAELRLASGALDAAGAAVAMEALLAGWRGDGQEREARVRLAELRLQSGDPRGAFDALREAEQGFPEAAASLRPRQAEALLAAIAREAPIGAVALFDAHAALLPPGEQTDRALASLAERLAALDLVDRARRVIGQAVARAVPGESRARLGLAQAKLAISAADPGGARASLADTEAGGLPEALRSDRIREDARALVAMGAYEQAADRLREAGPAALPELGELLAARQDWGGAASALGTYLDATLPGAGRLDDEARRLVARRAALLALAGDEAGLSALRVAEAPRMADGPYADAFTLMTADRVGGVGDLPRLRRELEVARAFPSRPEGLRAGASPAR